MGEDGVSLVFTEPFPFETIQYWHGADWDKRPPGMLMDLSPGLLAPIAIQTGRHSSQPRRLDRMRDVHLTWSNFFISGDRCTSIYDDANTAVAGIVDWPGLSEVAGIVRNGDGFTTSRSRLGNAEHISDKTMFATSNEPHNWGMWLLYVLPAVMHFVENRQIYDRLFVYADHPNMRAMLRRLGLKAADVVLHDCSKAYHFESIDVFRQPRREYCVPVETKATCARLRDQVAGSIIVPSAHHLYIGRHRRTAEMSSYRPLLNEGELRQRLEAMGYSPVDPSCIDPEEQIELFGSERKIVVLGGAGLFNAVFCKPGTKVVDIESTYDHLRNHSTVLSSMDVDYGIIVGEVDQGDPASHNKRWTIDVDRAAAAIARFMA